MGLYIIILIVSLIIAMRLLDFDTPTQEFVFVLHIMGFVPVVYRVIFDKHIANGFYYIGLFAIAVTVIVMVIDLYDYIKDKRGVGQSE